jgi:hypothetical protein
VQVSAEIRYDADPARVFEMLSDPAFQEAKCVASGALEHAVEVSLAEDGGATVLCRRKMPTEHVPDFVRSFIGATLTLVETQTWRPAGHDGSRTGAIAVQIEGAPVRFAGSLALVADGGGTLEPIEGELKASVPLLGGQIERAAEPAVMAAIKVEQRTGITWLADHPS